MHLHSRRAATPSPVLTLVVSSMPAVYAAVGLAVTLLAIIGILYYKNRKLKYQNYRLMDASGNGDNSQAGMTLYDDELETQPSTFIPFASSTFAYQPSVVP